MTTTAPRYHGTPGVPPRGADAGPTDHATLEIRTVADLAEILAGLPSQTPVTLDPVLRGAPGLSPDHHPRVIVANTAAFASRNPGRSGTGLLPGLELGARLIPEETAPIPPVAHACDPLVRMADAFDAGDLGDGLRALADALADAAHGVATEGTAWLPPASPVLEQLNDVTVILRQIAADMRSSLAPATDAEMRRAELMGV